MNQIGIDVSNDVFDATMCRSGKTHKRQFANTQSGHRQFMTWALSNAHAVAANTGTSNLLRQPLA